MFRRLRRCCRLNPLGNGLMTLRSCGQVPAIQVQRQNRKSNEATLHLILHVSSAQQQQQEHPQQQQQHNSRNTRSSNSSDSSSVTNEIVFQLLLPETGGLLHNERVIAVSKVPASLRQRPQVSSSCKRWSPRVSHSSSPST